MNTHDKYELPPLPAYETGFMSREAISTMRNYARAAIEADRKLTTKQLAAYESLVASLEAKCTHMRKMYDELKDRTNPDLLASERAANAILTSELEADRKRRGEPDAESIEKLAINRYRTVPAGLLAYKVVAGDGSRSLFSGTKDECKIVAAKLTEAFLDGAHVALHPAEPVKVPNLTDLLNLADAALRDDKRSRPKRGTWR